MDKNKEIILQDFIEFDSDEEEEAVVLPEQEQLLRYLQLQQSHAPSSSSTLTPTFMSKNTAVGLGRVEPSQAFFSSVNGRNGSSTADEQTKVSREESSPSLGIFPSLSTVQRLQIKDTAGFALSTTSSGSKRPLELANLKVDASKQAKFTNNEGDNKGQEKAQIPNPMIQRRQIQNREAARRSRSKKKAYIQQLEASKRRLNQLENELLKARAQGIYIGGTPLFEGEEQISTLLANSNTSGTAAFNFDVEHARWLEEHKRKMNELRSALDRHMPENELKVILNSCLKHYDEVINIKSLIIRSDVFHLLAGMWMSSVERCFMWLGGFQPSKTLEVIIEQVDPMDVTEGQLAKLYELHQNVLETEESMSRGLEALKQSLSDIMTQDSLDASLPNTPNYHAQMAIAMNKLSAIEGMVKQADILRHGTLHKLHELLTTHQAAKYFLMTFEYFNRLRTLSSFWMARAREDP